MRQIGVRHHFRSQPLDSAIRQIGVRYHFPYAGNRCSVPFPRCRCPVPIPHRYPVAFPQGSSVRKNGVRYHSGYHSRRPFPRCSAMRKNGENGAFQPQASAMRQNGVRYHFRHCPVPFSRFRAPPRDSIADPLLAASESRSRRNPSGLVALLAVCKTLGAIPLKKLDLVRIKFSLEPEKRPKECGNR